VCRKKCDSWSAPKEEFFINDGAEIMSK